MKARLRLIVAVFLFLVFLATCSFLRLLVLENDQGEIIKLLPLFRGGSFATAYIHSVEQIPVLEEYGVVGDRIQLERTVFYSYGAGLPLDEEGFDFQEGSFIVEKEKEFFNTITFRVARTPGQRLILGGKDILFQDLLEPGERLILRVYSIPGLVMRILAGSE